MLMTLFIGEWWNRDILSVMSQAVFSGAAPNVSNAFTINGQPGDLYRCASKKLISMSLYQENGKQEKEI